MSTSDRVVIGMDPHKRSATIEVMTGEETVIGAGRFGTGRDAHAAMTRHAKQWRNRVWAVEGCQGIGRQRTTFGMTAPSAAFADVCARPAACLL